MKLGYFCIEVYIHRPSSLGLDGGAYSIPTPEGRIKLSHKTYALPLANIFCLAQSQFSDIISALQMSIDRATCGGRIEGGAHPQGALVYPFTVRMTFSTWVMSLHLHLEVGDGAVELSGLTQGEYQCALV